jgi:catechol 2,3-dioxygenase-like lactoylglutathione lyase family enzyme
VSEPTHVHLIVSDLALSLSFYTTVFGMEEAFREGSRMVILSMPQSESTITLSAREGASGQDLGVSPVAFRLSSTRDPDDAIGEARSAGGNLIRRNQADVESGKAFVTDPDGYLIEIGRIAA